MPVCFSVCLTQPQNGAALPIPLNTNLLLLVLRCVDNEEKVEGIETCIDFIKLHTKYIYSLVSGSGVLFKDETDICKLSKNNIIILNDINVVCSILFDLCNRSLLLQYECLAYFEIEWPICGA